MQTHPYLWTASGKKWMVEALTPAMIDLKSIAYGLAKECRFGGQIEGFYSVARHSLLMRKALQTRLIRPLWIYALVHDAAEAYMRDMCKPIKVCLPDYVAMEDKVMSVIGEKFDIAMPMPKIIKEFDTRIVVDEASVLFGERPEWLKDFEDAGIASLGIEEQVWEHRYGNYQDDLEEFMYYFNLDLDAYHDAKSVGWVA